MMRLMPHPSPILSEAQALRCLLDGISPLAGQERIGLDQALGRVLAETLVAENAVPAFDNSAMDGYAVACKDAAREGEIRLAVSQRITAGLPPTPLKPGTAARIFTGAPLPNGADTVVMQEDCREENGYVVLQGPLTAGKHVRRAGEDIAADRAVLERGCVLRPQEMGLAASLGRATLAVYRKARVALVVTGNELVEPGTPLGPGQLYNSNRYTLTGLLAALGCETTGYYRVPDDLGATREALAEAARNADFILTSGGVSVGEEDYVQRAIAALGALHIRRIAIKPGKPLTHGHIQGTPLLGLPGNPVSLFVTFAVFARPALFKLQGRTHLSPLTLRARATFERRNPIKRREYLRARLHRTGDSGGLEVSIYPRQGSAVLSSTVWADCLAVIPEHGTVMPGQAIEVMPFSSLLSPLG